MITLPKYSTILLYRKKGKITPVILNERLIVRNMTHIFHINNIDPILWDDPIPTAIKANISRVIIYKDEKFLIGQSRKVTESLHLGR
jgi:hypothetical protein